MNMVVSNWSANVVALAAYAVAAVMHLRGVRDGATDARRQGRRCPARHGRGGVAFQAGRARGGPGRGVPGRLLVAPLHLGPNVQDVILAMAAPALIVLGAPWLGSRGVGRGPEPGAGRRAARGAGGARRLPPPRRPALAERRIAGQAWLALARGGHGDVLRCLVGDGTCRRFDAAVRSPAVYALEMITYLARAWRCGCSWWSHGRCGPSCRRCGGSSSCWSDRVGTVLGLIRAYGPGWLTRHTLIPAGASPPLCPTSRRAGRSCG